MKVKPPPPFYLPGDTAGWVFFLFDQRSSVLRSAIIPCGAQSFRSLVAGDSEIEKADESLTSGQRWMEVVQQQQTQRGAFVKNQ